MAAFNEDTRVKIPATVQVLRLGYNYQSMKEADIDFDTKIFVSRFKSSLERINGRDFSAEEIAGSAVLLLLGACLVNAFPKEKKLNIPPLVFSVLFTRSLKVSRTLNSGSIMVVNSSLSSGSSSFQQKKMSGES